MHFKRVAENRASIWSWQLLHLKRWPTELARVIRQTIPSSAAAEHGAAAAWSKDELLSRERQGRDGEKEEDGWCFHGCMTKNVAGPWEILQQQPGNERLKAPPSSRSSHGL